MKPDKIKVNRRVKISHTPKRLYLDANVLLSFVKGESGGKFRSMYSHVVDFLSLVEKFGDTLVISDFFVEETKKDTYCEKQTDKETRECILEYFEGQKIKFVDTTSKDKKKAKEINQDYGIHLKDALNAQLALKSGADVIITWNETDFEKVTEIIPYNTPEGYLVRFFL